MDAGSGRDAWSRGMRWGLGLLVLAGVLWRVGRYLAQFPIWGDEAFILLNLADLDYAGLAGPLRYCQVAPLFFLWSEATAFHLLGTSELALRLLPLLAGLLALVLFWQLCVRVLPPPAALFAVGLLAVSYYPVRHGVEVKPYAFDLLASVALLSAALAWLREPARLARLLLLALIVPFALLFSYPAVFVAGTIAVVLAVPAWRAGPRACALLALYGVLLVATFVAHYEIVGKSQASAERAAATDTFMHRYWSDSFPPASLVRFPLWLVDVHAGNMFAYPSGGKRGASILSLALFVVGIATLWRQGARNLVALCLGPFALTLLAAILEKYPYGGSARVAQHLAPAICLAMGLGLAGAVAWLKSETARSRATLGLCGLMLAIAVAGVGLDWLRPYKTVHDWEARSFAREIRTSASPADSIVVSNSYDSLPSEIRWYLHAIGCPLHFDGDLKEPASGQGLWLVSFDPAPVPAEKLIEQAKLAGWAPTHYRSTFIPTDTKDLPSCYCTRFRLSSPASLRTDAGHAPPLMQFASHARGAVAAFFGLDLSDANSW